jgi:hypothetical protein
MHAEQGGRGLEGFLLAAALFKGGDVTIEEGGLE